MNEALDSLEPADRGRAAREALIGTTIAGGRYVLRSLLGHGGMGAVYEGEHIGIGKKCAIKFVDPEFATDERVVSRFAREARAMSSVESAHIVTIFDAGTESGRPYLVMELLRGEDLGQWLRRARRIPLADALHIVAQVLKGLARAHAVGIVHRDLKPDNVFLVKGASDPLFAKIVDFGVSKIERPQNRTTPLALTGRGTVLGTPFYMCPEQAQAMPDIDGRADLYSVGAILFECLTGRPPHTGETYEQVILSICMRDAPDARAIDPNIPAPVAAFLAHALARDRVQRFASAERMLAALHVVAPEERDRVPLDPPSAETLLSASPPADALPKAAPTLLAGGAAAARSPSSPPQKPQLAATRISGSHVASATPQPAPAKPLAVEAPVALASAPSKRRGRSATTLFVTAAVATLTGIGVMLGIVLLLDTKKPPPAAPRHHATTASAPAATPSAAIPSAEPETDPAPASASSASSTAPPPTATPTAPKPHPTAKPAGKPLDIARDLP